MILMLAGRGAAVVCSGVAVSAAQRHSSGYAVLSDSVRVVAGHPDTDCRRRGWALAECAAGIEIAEESERSSMAVVEW